MPTGMWSSPEGPLLLVLVGLPASGKSTWLRTNGIPAISSDHLRALLADDVTDQSINRHVFLHVRALARTRLGLRRPVTAIDATSVALQGRAAYIRMARAHGARVEAVFFDTPLDECLRRNLERERQVPEAAIRKMAAELVRPSAAEGFDAVHIVAP